MNLQNDTKDVKKVLLIDVSNLFFRAFHSVPKHFTDQEGRPSNAIYGVVSMIFGLLEKEKPDYLFAAQDLKEKTLRHKKLDSYKEGRPKMPEELVSQLSRIFGFFDVAEIPLLSHVGYEADDIIATIARHFEKKRDFSIGILSSDHDLLQLVSEQIHVLLPQNGGKPFKHMDATAVEEKLGVPPALVPDYKALAGDSSDKLVGIPGIGPKGAVEILKNCGSVEAALDDHAHLAERYQILLKKHRKDALFTKEMALLHDDLPIEGFDPDAGKVPEQMPKQLPDFLESISSRRLLSRAEKIFHASPIDEEHQMSLF